MQCLLCNLIVHLMCNDFQCYKDVDFMTIDPYYNAFNILQKNSPFAFCL